MPEEVEPIKALADYAYKFFEHKKRGEAEDAKRFWALTNRYPTWIEAMVRVVHDDSQWLPDDYKYQYIIDTLNNLSEGWDPEEGMYDLEADVYNHDLLEWLGSHNARAEYVDEVVEETGWPKDGGLFVALQYGQQREMQEVWNHVVEALKSRLVDIEDGVEETFERFGKGPEGVKEWRPEN